MIAFCKIFLIHRHKAAIFDRARPSDRGVSCCFFVVLVVFWGFVFVCFVCLFSGCGLPLLFAPLTGPIGLRNGPRSLLTPQGGMLLYYAFVNGTNTVLRPGESREGEGRKKRVTHAAGVAHVSRRSNQAILHA